MPYQLRISKRPSKVTIPIMKLRRSFKKLKIDRTMPTTRKFLVKIVKLETCTVKAKVTIAKATQLVSHLV